jgi:hypothetical protein
MIQQKIQEKQNPAPKRMKRETSRPEPAQSVKEETEKDEKDADDEHELEILEDEVNAMKTAASALETWAKVVTRRFPFGGTILSIDEINDRSVPGTVPAWCTFGSLAGCYWVAKGDTGDTHWTNGQVKDIARLMAEPEVRKAALAYLETRADMGEFAEWYDEILSFFAETGEAGSGANAG